MSASRGKANEQGCEECGVSPSAACPLMALRRYCPRLTQSESACSACEAKDRELVTARAAANTWKEENTRLRVQSAVTCSDPDRAEFLAEAQAKLTAVIEKGDIEAVRWMIQTAVDYHANQAAGAEAMDVPESTKYHDDREKELLALLTPSATAYTRDEIDEL